MILTLPWGCCGLAVFQIGSDTELASREAPQALYGLGHVPTGQRIGAVLTHLGRRLQFRGL